MQADDPTETAPAEAPPEGTTLADLVRERLERDALRPEAAADAIGIPTARLIGLLQGRAPNFSTQRRIEAWLRGETVAAESEPEELTPEVVAAAPGEVSEPAAVESSTPAPAAETPAPAPAPKRRGRPPKVKPAETATAEPAAAQSEPPAPKRRGRPPKNPAATTPSAEPAMPKRRGRPPKHRDQTEASAPKRRGRPPKNPPAEAAAPKRRGRPPKNPAAAAEPPKRRGRPPKHPLAAAAPAASAPLELLPKRRGRPPKNRSPIGAALRELVALADDALALAVHRADPARRKRIEAALR